MVIPLGRGSMMRDNRRRGGPGIKGKEPALTSALFHFENAARRHPGERRTPCVCVCVRAPPTAAGCPRGRRTRESDPSDIRSIMKLTRFLTAFTATLSCMPAAVTAAAADPAAEAAALAIAKKLYPTCAVSRRVPDHRSDPPFGPVSIPLLAARCSFFADHPRRPVLSSSASRSWFQSPTAASQTPSVSALT